MPLKMPPKASAPAKPSAGLILPGQKFQIKRAADLNNVPTTAAQDITTLQEIQSVKAKESTRDDLLNRVIRFRRAGIEVEITPDPSQLVAVKGIVRQQFGCITGAAGTGKTTVERIILSVIEQGMHQVDVARYGKDGSDPETADRKPNKVPAIAFAAFTGKAMQQMKRNLPEDYMANCFTIHFLLGFYPMWYEDAVPDDFGNLQIKMKMKFVPYYDRAHKLPWKVIILDEASMIPVDLWNMLIDACNPDVRIILIGDINQLPPVMGRSVFGYALQKWPSYELTQIHRQKGEDNPIVDNAWRILQGKKPVDVSGRFDIVPCDRGEIAGLKKLLQVTLLLHKKGIFVPQPEDGSAGDMIIVPQNVGELGQVRLNEYLVPHFNPPSAIEIDPKGRRQTIVAGFDHKALAVGDKVMATVNDYVTNVTNGMIGRILSIIPNDKYTGKMVGKIENADHHFDEDAIDKMMNFSLSPEEIDAPQAIVESDPRKKAASHIVTVDFGLNQLGSQIIVDFSTAGQVNSLMLANAATCHKCQGSEFKTVIILCHSSNSNMLYREWLYTAVTRAQERVILVCDNRGLLTALNKQRIKGANLREKAQSFIDWTNESLKRGQEASLPFLWNPKEI